MKKIIFILCIVLSQVLLFAANDPFEQAFAIVESRIKFYEVRGQLLSGNDPASLSFQADHGNSTNFMTSCAGIEKVMDLLSGKITQLELVRESNDSFKEQWVRLGITIVRLKIGSGKMKDFEPFKLIFGSRRNITTVVSPCIQEDFQRICDESNDFDMVLNLIRDFRKQKTEKHSLTDIERIVAEIEGRPLQQGIAPKPKREPKSKSKQMRVKTTLRVTEPLIIPVQEGKDIVVEKTVPALVPVVVSEPGMVAEKVGNIYTSAEFKPMELIKLSDEVVDDEDASSLETPIPFVKAALALPTVPEAVKKYPVKKRHLSNLRALLGSSDPSPRWNQALNAVAALVTHTGGGIDGSLGNGSETAFWVGKSRFIVHAPHGTQKGEPLSGDRLFFFKSGLNRAGITLGSLSES